MTESTVGGEEFVRPYRSGFADWLLDKRRLNSRAGWVAYFAIAITVTLAYWAVAWSEGSLPEHAGLIHVILPLFAFAGLAALAWFNLLARRALAAARPLLKVDDAGYQLLSYRLTTMPAPVFIAGACIGLLALVLLTTFRPPNLFETLHIMVTPIATMIEWALQFLVWTWVGVVGMEIARKLWVIDDIYSNHIQINVLRPGALSAFSRVSAAMVIFTVGAVVLATIALAQFGGTVTWALGASVPTFLAAIAFVAPLWGGHRLMAQEKARNLDALGERIAATIASLRARVEADEFEQVGPLKVTLEGLKIARDEYDSVSTWPWQRGTLAGVVTALIAPIAVWVFTRVLETVVP